MPHAGLEPATLAPESQAITQLTKRSAGKPTQCLRHQNQEVAKCLPKTQPVLRPQNQTASRQGGPKKQKNRKNNQKNNQKQKISRKSNLFFDYFYETEKACFLEQEKNGRLVKRVGPLLNIRVPFALVQFCIKYQSIFVVQITYASQSQEPSYGQHGPYYSSDLQVTPRCFGVRNTEGHGPFIGGETSDTYRRQDTFGCEMPPKRP